MASLEEGRMENLVTEKLARMSYEAQIHRDSLEGHVRGEVTVSSQLEWVPGATFHNTCAPPIAAATFPSTEASLWGSVS